MKDDEKTKRELIDELVTLRRKIADQERLLAGYRGAENALAEEKKISDMIIECLPGIFYLFDEEGKFFRWNRNLEVVSGYSAEEIARMHPLDFFDGEDRRIEEEHIRDVFQKGPTTSEAELVSKDGRRTPFFFTCMMVTVGDRRCAIGTGIDIAERRRTEETVRLLNRQNELILKSAGEGIYGVDLHGNMTFINPSALKMLGWKAWEIIGKKPHDIMHHSKPDGTPYPVKDCPIYAAFKDGAVHHATDEVFWKKDGTCFPVEYTSTPIVENNRLAGAVVVFRDITERKYAEESLLESERKLQAITDAASDAIVLIDDEEKIVYWNPAACKLLGYQPEEIAGKNIIDVIPPRYREAHRKAFRRFVETGQGTLLGKTYEVAALKKDGAEIPIELSISGIRLKGRWHSAGVIRDISERKKLEQQLLQSQKMEAVGQLAGGIAHDFNNILSAIVGYGDILRIKMKKDDPLRANVVHLLEAAYRAAHLTKSLLAFSRQQILHARPTNLTEVIRRVERLLRRVIGEDIELKTVFKQETATVNADSSQLEQVFMNLAINARDAMPHGGSFVIETDMIELDDSFNRAHGYGERGWYALVSVADTGTGMDEATRKRIFEPFFTTKELGKGTGLGLSIVYGIIKQHRGYINVYSEPGGGTTFRIYLPLITMEGESRTPAAGIPEEKLPGGTETVLVAEDDETLRKLSHTVLEEYGYTVIEAEDGADAVNKFLMHKDVIKLIILDMIMPKKNGREVYQEIKKVQPDVKALFVSGYTADRRISEDLLERGVEFLMKPISPMDLLKKVRAVLGSGSPEH